jgi:ribonuclease R
VEAWLKCKYMREHLGEEFGGLVTSVTSFGLFVTLDAMFVEGLVHITELGGEYFRFDEARQELRGERTGIRYALGSRVRVQVSRVDLDGRRIDFRLVSDQDDVVLRAMREKSGSAADTSSGDSRPARDRSSRAATGSKPAGAPGKRAGTRAEGRSAERKMAGKSKKGRR